MGFVGIDPAAMFVLADTVDQYALRLTLARRSAAAVLNRHPVGIWPAVAGSLSSLETQLATESEVLRWRVQVIQQAQDLAVAGVPGDHHSLALFAATAAFDLDSWETSYTQWQADRAVDLLWSASPREAAAIFSTMSLAEIDELVRRYPALVGGLDGAPANARYAANRLLITDEIATLGNYVSEFREIDSRVAEIIVDHLEDRIAEYQSWLREGRQILLFEPYGDGRVVEVFGDLESAQRIAVSVPGMANDITNFSTDGGGFRTNAADLFASSEPGVATIAWLGYDTPDSVGAASTGAASAGAPALQSFLEGIDPHRDRNITVVAHSYGSVLAGTAAGVGLEADNLVFVGSPGTTLPNAGDAKLRSGGLVWSALADNDPIGMAISPGELPPPWVPIPLWPIWERIDEANDGHEQLWHGTNPANDRFGALEFTTDGCSGHSEYYQGGSLENLAKIASGLYSEVELVDPPPGSGSW